MDYFLASAHLLAHTGAHEEGDRLMSKSTVLAALCGAAAATILLTCLITPFLFWWFGRLPPAEERSPLPSNPIAPSMPPAGKQTAGVPMLTTGELVANFDRYRGKRVRVFGKGRVFGQRDQVEIWIRLDQGKVTGSAPFADRIDFGDSDVEMTIEGFVDERDPQGVSLVHCKRIFP
jgi:hypothetical protein